MRSALAYSPRPGPLRDTGAVAALAYFGSIALVALLAANPLLLAGAGAAATVAGLRAGAGRALATTARYAGVLALLFVVVNALASQRGDTILVRGWQVPVLGRMDVSLEALAEGAVIAGRLVVVLLVFAVLSATVDPDRLMRLLRPVARRSAMTATLIARMVPLAARDHARLREAARLRGPVAAPTGRVATVRRLVAASLDRAVGVAATLELRGYAAGPPRRPAMPATGRDSRRFGVAGAAMALVGGAALTGGAAGFEAYPTIEMDAGAATVAAAVALPVLASLPFSTRRAPAPRRTGRLARA